MIFSKIDECVFYDGKTILIVYTDDTILIGPDQQEIDDLIKKLGKVFSVFVLQFTGNYFQL